MSIPMLCSPQCSLMQLSGSMFSPLQRIYQCCGNTSAIIIRSAASNAVSNSNASYKVLSSDRTNNLDLPLQAYMESKLWQMM